MYTDPEAESGLYLAIFSLEEDRLSNIQPLPNRSYCSIPIRRVSLDLMRNSSMTSPAIRGSQNERKDFSDSSLLPSTVFL